MHRTKIAWNPRFKPYICSVIIVLSGWLPGQPPHFLEGWTRSLLSSKEFAL
nr:MAG TPA: hypothetical protein [Caudoviricetes sp.]